MMDEEGHDEDAAERICGALQAESKNDNGNVEELRDALARGQGLLSEVGVELNSAVDLPAIDSEWVAFKSETDGYDRRIDTPIVRKADGDGDDAEKRIAYAPETGEIRQPSWSPDGKHVAHYRYGRYEGSTAPEIFVMSSGGEDATRLTFNEVRDENPRFSPDSEWLTFESDSQVWIMNADGSDKKRLTERGGQPDWSPDGNHIVYIGPEHTIWVMDADGSDKQQLTTRPEGPVGQGES